MPSNHLILCCPLLLLLSIFPSIRIFSNESALSIRCPQQLEFQLQPSVLPMNTQAWSPLGWTGLISLQAKGLLRVFSNTTVQNHQFFSAQFSLATHSSAPAWKIPWAEEPSRLQSMRSLRVGHDWATSLFSLSCIGEGNGNPLQCPCLENPRDGGAWWASVYGVAQSQTRLKWLSSSSSFLYSPTLISLHDYWKNHRFD